MEAFIAAVPIFNKDMSVSMYEFNCETGRRALYSGSPSPGLDGSLSAFAIDVLNDVGFEPLSGGKPIITEFDQFSILYPLTTDITFARDNMIISISNSVPPTQSYIEVIWKLKLEGFKFAFSRFDGNPDYDAFIQMMDYVIIDAQMVNCLDVLERCKKDYPGIKYIANNVSTRVMFAQLRNSDFDMFEGRFYNQPISIKHTQIAPLKINAIQLLNIVNNEDFSMEEVSRVISQDTALSVALLRLVNSPAVGVRQKISSIKHAVVILGQKEFRKWATTAVTRNMSFDKPSELVRLSLVRAKFAENLAQSVGLVLQASNLFLTGLFSVIDIVLDTTMEEALKILNVTTPIKNALLGKRGPLSSVIDLIHAYEKADWFTVYRIMATHDLTIEAIFEAFIDALRWYKKLLEY